VQQLGRPDGSAGERQGGSAGQRQGGSAGERQGGSAGQRSRGSAGQMLPFMALLLMLAVGLAAVAIRLAPLVDDAARARTAADAAALAGAAEGRPGAERLAEANDGVLVEFSRSGQLVTVRVRVGSASAVAAAEATVTWERP